MLKFDSSFDSGNLFSARFKSATSYDLIL